MPCTEIAKEGAESRNRGAAERKQNEVIWSLDASTWLEEEQPEVSKIKDRGEPEEESQGREDEYVASGSR